MILWNLADFDAPRREALPGTNMRQNMPDFEAPRREAVPGKIMIQNTRNFRESLYI